MEKHIKMLCALAICFLLKSGAADPRIDEESRTTNDLQGSAPAPICPTYRSRYDFSSHHLNLRPIIGILSAEPNTAMARGSRTKGWKNITSYITASYVKSFEGAGARVVPIMINKSPEYYEMMAKNLNGIVFPSANLVSFRRAAQQLYQHVMNANANGTVLPLWSSSYGYLTLMHVASGDWRRSMSSNTMVKCNFNDRRERRNDGKDALIFVQGAEDSKMFSNMPDRLLAALQSERITYHSTGWCMTQDKFNSLRLNDTFKILATSLDTDGLEFISNVEHRQYPLFATQWRGEKPAYDWRVGVNIPRTKEALQVNTKLMEMFLDHARQNQNSFPDGAEEDHLIDKFTTYPTHQLFGTYNLRSYLFNESD